MRHLIIISLFAGCLLATPQIDYYKYHSYGPQRMLAGYTHIYHIKPMWSFTATCDSSLNNCYSAGYTPDGTEVLYISPDISPPGGVQNQVWQQYYPTYKATNVGANGNAAGHWHIIRSHGTAITLTSTATTRFYAETNYLKPYFWTQNTAPNAAPGLFNGFPAGTTYKYWGANTYSQCY